LVVKDDDYRKNNFEDDSMEILSYDSSVQVNKDYSINRKDIIRVKVVKEVEHKDWKQRIRIKRVDLIGNFQATSNGNSLAVATVNHENSTDFIINYSKTLKVGDEYTFQFEFNATKYYPVSKSIFYDEVFITGKLDYDNFCHQITQRFTFPYKIKVIDFRPSPPNESNGTIAFQFNNLEASQDLAYAVVVRRRRWLKGAGIWLANAIGSGAIGKYLV